MTGLAEVKAEKRRPSAEVEVLAELVRQAESRLVGQQAIMLAAAQRGTALAALLFGAAAALLGVLARGGQLPETVRLVTTVTVAALVPGALFAFFSGPLFRIRTAGAADTRPIRIYDSRHSLLLATLARYEVDLQSNRTMLQNCIGRQMFSLALIAFSIFIYGYGRIPKAIPDSFIVEARSGAMIAVPASECGKPFVQCSQKGWASKKALDSGRVPEESN